MLSLVDGFPGLPVVFVGPHPSPQSGIVGRHHSAFTARGDDLVLAERPGGNVGEGPGVAVADHGPVGLRAVFDQPKAVVPAERLDIRHPGWPAAEVHDDDCGRARCDGDLDGLSGDVAGLGVNVGEDRSQPDRYDRGCGGDERVRGASPQRVRIVKLCVAFECGAIQNPLNLQAQVEGAVAMALGGALFERIEFNDGEILNAAFSAYRVPRQADLPPLETVLLNRPDLPSVGAGETPMIAVAPALAGAVWAATGMRLRSLPLQVVWEEPTQDGRSVG